MAEAYGENEEKYGKGLVGPTGIELLKLCHEAGIIQLTQEAWGYISDFWSTYDPTYVDLIWQLYPELARTNVINQRPQANKILAFCGGKGEGVRGYPAVVKGKFLLRAYQPELDRLAEELDAWNPNLVVALGNTALWALQGVTAISKNRGTTMMSTHCVAGFKVLPTYHPAAIFQQWSLRPVVVIDLMKAAREAEFPDIRRPKREIWIEPTLEDLDEFYDRYIQGCQILSVDIETSGKMVTCIGFAPTKEHALVVPFFDPRRKGRSYWPNVEYEYRARRFVQRVLEDGSIRKLFQNGLYDIAFLWRADGVRVMGAEEDTMLAHHALQPESLKGLGFLGSVYTDFGAWKHMREETETIKRDD